MLSRRAAPRREITIDGAVYNAVMRPTFVLWMGLLYALLLSGCSPATTPTTALPAPGGEGTTAFVHVTVVPLDIQRLVPDQTILVRDGRITAMGPSAGVAVPAGARVIDGRGKYLMPGLADMHTHLALEEDLLLYLARGVTTVRNMWGTPLHLEWRDRIKRGQMIGPTIITAGPIVDGDPPAHDGSLVALTAEDAERAVALQKQAGYDFIKVYTRLPLPAYQRLVVAAREAGMPVAGHVPRAVGLSGVLDARQASIEHLTGFLDALQAESSPVRGKFDRESLDKRINFVDEAMLPTLAEEVRERGVFSCPTRIVINEIAPAEARERLGRQEMRYLKPLYPAMWDPGPRPDPTPEALANMQRSNALNDRIIRALRDAGAPLLVGTDTGNPFVVPGFSMHEELELLVRAGLTPYEALRAATRGAAELLRVTGDVGSVAVGQRADLLLVSGNPLADVAHVRRLSGVMARGRWFSEGDLAALLAQVEASAKGTADPFAGMPALGGGGKRELLATYEVIWKGATFGRERLVVERDEKNQRVIRAQAYDARYGQRSALSLYAGATGDGERLVIESDGSKGRGRAAVERADGRARMNGKLLSGVTFAKEEAAPGGVLLGAEEFLAGNVLVGQRLHDLPVGKEQEVRIQNLSFGSSADLSEASFRVVRSPDTTISFRGADVPARRYEMTPARGPKNVLWIDPDGFPIAFEIEAYGAAVQFKRIE